MVHPQCSNQPSSSDTWNGDMLYIAAGDVTFRGRGPESPDLKLAKLMFIWNFVVGGV